MTCWACANPTGGGYSTGCPQCALRQIARSPEFYASQKAKALTPAYAARLKALGEDIKAVHAEVKAMAETIYAGAPKA